MATKGDLGVAGSAIPRRQGWLIAFLAATLLVVAATGWIYGRMDRYQADGRAWLVNPDFATRPGERVPWGWALEGPADGITVADGTVRLTNTDPAGGIGLRQIVRRSRGDASVFELSVTAGTEALAGGVRYWRGGRITFTDQGDQFPRGASRELANLQRSKPPAVYRKRFVFGSDTPEIELALRLRYATGTLVVRDLKIVGLVERPAFQRAADVLRVAWALLFVGGLGLALRSVRGRAARVIVATSAIGAAVIILMPHSGREAIAQALSQGILNGAVATETAARIGHFFLFVALAVLTRALRPRDPAGWQLLALGLLAGASELSQFMADARTPSLVDWAVDTAGAALGLVLMWLARSGGGERKPTRPPPGSGPG